MSLNPVEDTGMVDTASKIDLKCGCGAGWGISGLLSSSDLTTFVQAWLQAGHDHDHDDMAQDDLLAEAIQEKADREAAYEDEDDDG